MGGGADELDRAVAQSRSASLDRRNMDHLQIDPLVPIKSEGGRGRTGEIGIGDKIGNSKSHTINLPGKRMITERAGFV